MERDVLGGVSLDGGLHALHRPLRAAGGVERELDGLKDVGVLALVHVVTVLGRQLEEELPHSQGTQAVRARLGDAQEERGGEQAAAVSVELVVGDELDEQRDAVKARVVLQQRQEQLSSPPRGARSQPLGVAADEQAQLGLVDDNNGSIDRSGRHTLVLRRRRV